ncbi:hypothetical protein LE181_01855 [Streptomyces sp. SCA3-4]|uniref:hypothetical protein n=1 Tax=Streptomyces sichuanensis TaxID=2871810 RepID=UPI001CE2A225|nr:hypothetical protein [Streptomyces sichuanensis]MCA6090920.1 hypothetical protein [Streptomyces sichuanensis]
MDLTEVVKSVEAGNGCAAISVKKLRNALPATKAKKRVVQRISAALREGGYRHLPFEIPRRQDRMVLVYRLDGSPASALLSLAA